MTHSNSDEPEDNVFWCNESGKLIPASPQVTDEERSRRDFERHALESRFNAYLPTWLSLGIWSLDEACRLLAGIPIRPIARNSDIDDKAHFTRKADYKHLLFVAETHKNLSNGATPAEWIDWFKTSGVASQISCVPSFVALPSGAPEMAAPVVASAAPIPRQRFQENEILRVIGELGYTAKAIPKSPPGKKGPKAAVRAKLKMTSGVFDLAWERLRNQGDIQDA